ncbi:MAG: hypothetical protein HRU26_09410 [Psychroserpens sp.]|nr:hypothetical protein [Psychroserpens sp.]
MRGVLIRLDQDDKQTLSEIHFYNGLKRLLTVKALELPDRGNKRSISRINAGTYKCKLRWSQKYKWHFILENVEVRFSQLFGIPYLIILDFGENLCAIQLIFLQYLRYLVEGRFVQIPSKNSVKKHQLHISYHRNFGFHF